MSSVATTIAPDAAVDALDGTRFAVVDVETSGLSVPWSRVLQVAVVTVRADGQVLDRWSSLVRPSLRRVGPTHIHGFTARALRRAPKFATVAPELVRRLDGTVFTAHNARFDWGFIARGLRRAGYRVPDTTRLCTMRLARAIDPDAGSYRLVDVGERYGVVMANAHDALADADAVAALLPHLLPASGATTLTALPARTRQHHGVASGHHPAVVAPMAGAADERPAPEPSSGSGPGSS